MFGRNKTKIVSPDQVLPGRSERSFPLSVKHRVLEAPLVTDSAPEGYEVAIFGLGCFWGAEEIYWQIPGVWSTSVGYAGGSTPNPSYEEVCSGMTDHTEAIRIVFDPEVVSYADLVKRFFEVHDPTQGMRQGNDVGTQYRSAIYFTSPEQEETARELTAVYGVDALSPPHRCHHHRDQAGADDLLLRRGPPPAVPREEPLRIPLSRQHRDQVPRLSFALLVDWDTGEVTDLPRKAAARTARLAALPLGYAGRSALGFGKRMGGKPAELVLADIQARTAEQLFRTLGELKGGAMKFGQAMSVLEAALPDELVGPYRAQLTRLQDSAPPMPTGQVRDALARDLGPDWRKQLVWLDGGPTAAASIGQVHKGRWMDGREVAVKVQYPGAGDALRSDLRQLARLAKTFQPMMPGVDIKPLVAELQDRAADELDYPLEADAQSAFASAFRGDPEIVIPDVVAVGETVLVTEWLESPASLASVIASGTQEERDHYGELWCGSCSPVRPAQACSTRTRTPATSGCSRPPTALPADSGYSTSARWPGSPAARCRWRWAR